MRFLVAAGVALAFICSAPALACSMGAQHGPLNLTPEEIDAEARRLLAEPGIVIAEAVVLRTTDRQRGLLRVDRVLRGEAPETLEVWQMICAYGFLNQNERGIIAHTNRRPLRHFLHRQIGEAVRRIAATE